MATSLFAKIPLLAGRYQHEARFVLPDLPEEEQVLAFQRCGPGLAGSYGGVRFVYGPH